MKRVWIAGLLFVCVQPHAHAEEAGFPAIRIGDTWVYTGHQKDKRLRSQPLHLAVEIEGDAGASRLLPVHRDPGIPDEWQIGQVLDPVPAGTCVADLLAGLQILSVDQCESPPRAGMRWTRELPPAANGRQLRFDIRYVGRKRIKVPAGRFLAHRFDIEQTETRGSLTGRTRRVYWYAPEVRGIVIMDSQPVDELGIGRWPRLHAELEKFEEASESGS